MDDQSDRGMDGQTDVLSAVVFRVFKCFLMFLVGIATGCAVVFYE